MIRGLGFLGVRVPDAGTFAAAVHLYRELLGLPVILDEPGRCWFRLGDGTQLHVYGPPEEDHVFFGAAPCVGFVVEDVPATRARLEAAGIRFLTEIEKAGNTAWCHYRGPDGAVYELIGGRGSAGPR
jgi:catechol 2,3-dioxygenase-like lactoylglutathione lyase family enzyme